MSAQRQATIGRRWGQFKTSQWGQFRPPFSLLLGAWARRHQLRLADAVYVELAMSRGLPLITTDRRLQPVPIADIVVA